MWFWMLGGILSVAIVIMVVWRHTEPEPEFDDVLEVLRRLQ